ncbi:hypothetical protein I3271_03270 [Photobacterium leiognathi]|uniref:flagellin N-terminal helical domain-containing protein n=1 Tax=Photobacterium leiognathi TaxID=553611 RepID=UPI001EE0F741|nr:flagellin [Photobacterium leiognathi]MCG3883702.1 hypothetical protein [Photobacterium leiognathi]
MLSINYNSASRNAVNQVSNAQAGISKAMTALSTGNRINSAAGSAMASRMQVQSNSLDTAVNNANMGVNLIQTMDGAMQETEELLQRMTKLTEMSKNDAYSTQDRDMMDQEFGALVAELDRNAQSANYNGISLINNAGHSAGTATFNKDVTKGVSFDSTNNELTFKVDTKGTAGDSSIDVTVTFEERSLSADDIVGTINEALKGKNANAQASINSEGRLVINSNDRVDGKTITESKVHTFGGDAANVLGTPVKSEDGKAGFNDTVINVGSSGNSYDNIYLKTVDLSSKGLGLKGASLTNSADLEKTLSTLKAALDTVTEHRSHLGAAQKRLGFASDNLQNVKNNTDASLSSIQDTDYAAGTMKLAKEKVLSSASQAMLGQSNQMQGEVTQLLK